MVEQCNSMVEWGTVLWNVQQHGRTVWNSVVEQCGMVWWNSGTAWWNSGTVWQSVVVQCGTVWWNSETVW